MEPFLVSRADRGGGALRDRLRSEGYLFIPGMLPKREVEYVRTDIAAALAGAAWLAAGTDPSDAIPGPTPRRETADDFWDGYRAIQQLESFHRLAHRPELVSLVGEILGGDVLVHPRKIARATFPSDTEYTTPPHQDFRTIQGTSDVLTVWVPLSDCPPELGGLKVLAGPRDRLLPVGPAKGAGGMTTGISDDDPAWRGGPFRQGDVLVFHSLTVHGAFPNVADRLRLSVDYRYQRADEPVTALSLLPHHHPTIPGWPELTAGWQTTEWIEAPAAPVADVSDYGGDIPVPPSRLVSVAG